MKKLKYILVVLLAFMTFILGAGSGMVHICSAYCKKQICSSSSHTCNPLTTDNEQCCYHDKTSNHENTDTEISEICSCLNLSYNIDFFKLSHDDDMVSYTPVITDVLEILSLNFFTKTASISYGKAINAPPLGNEGRKLLALHSILII